MKIKKRFIVVLSVTGIVLVAFLAFAASCQTSEAPATVSVEPTTKLDVDLLGTQHTYFLHKEASDD